MNKIISLLLCILFLIVFPAHTLAIAQEPEEITETVSESFPYEAMKSQHISLYFWVVPFSGQIKVGWKDNGDVELVKIYISSDNESFEFAGETDQNFYVIDNLKHREKYYIKLEGITKSDEKIETDSQTVRVK